MAEARLVVYDTRIETMAAPGGSIWEWVGDKCREVRAEAIAGAPMRTGYLKGSIRVDRRKLVRGCVGRVRATAYYASWVHDGTGYQWAPRELHGEPGPGSKGRWRPGMELQFKSKRWPGGSLAGVRGQKAQPFLKDALDLVMR
jgi:hypothetical protein